MTAHRSNTRVRLLAAGSALAVLAACAQPIDVDLRDRFGNPFDTTSAAQTATASRPIPDARGVLSYPNYQVALARRGDNVADVAARVGIAPDELARFNGVKTGDRLREGEVLVLPGTVGPQTLTPGATQPGAINITELAGPAIDRAPVDEARAQPAQPAAGPEPVRHKVARGETAFTISRLYGVTVRSLAEWNGLGPDFAIREGQFLLIPPTATVRTAAVEPAATQPGQGTPTPTPPSAVEPLPEEETTPAAQVEETVPETENLESQRTVASASEALMSLPVKGSIVRDFEAGKSPGITLSADAGSPVTAAASGTVKLISKTADAREIVILEHDRNVLSVYANVGDIAVAKGDQVSKGQRIGAVRPGRDAFLQFEVFEGTQRVDPNTYLQ